MGIFDFLRKIISIFSGEEAFNQLTPEFFAKQKIKMITPQKYFKFLMKKYLELCALVEERKLKGMSWPLNWIDKAKLIEKEIEETANLIGVSPFKDGKEKLSETLEKLIHKI